MNGGPTVRSLRQGGWLAGSGLLAFAVAPAVWSQPATFAPTFSAARAWQDLEAQCALGPREPGTAGHTAGRRFLAAALEKITPRVSSQRFVGSLDGRPVSLTNLIADIGPPGPRPAVICAHWDTRPWADQDPDPAKRTVPILGADDGASGVAVALEVARVVRPRIPVRIVLFDGEDLGHDLNGFFQGSRYYAAHLGSERPRWAILLDMVGQRNLVIPREQLSEQSAPDLLAGIFAVARQQRSPAFVDQPGQTIYDDQYPLIQAGIPAIDLIDFDYPAWHTTSDTPAQCSAASLGEVGRVVADYLDRV